MLSTRGPFQSFLPDWLSCHARCMRMASLKFLQPSSDSCLMTLTAFCPGVYRHLMWSPCDMTTWSHVTDADYPTLCWWQLRHLYLYVMCWKSNIIIIHKCTINWDPMVDLANILMKNLGGAVISLLANSKGVLTLMLNSVFSTEMHCLSLQSLNCWIFTSNLWNVCLPLLAVGTLSLQCRPFSVTHLFIYTKNSDGVTKLVFWSLKEVWCCSALLAHSFTLYRLSYQYGVKFVTCVTFIKACIERTF